MLQSLDALAGRIYQPITGELIQVVENLKSLRQGQDQHMTPLLTYLFDRGGKGMRPAVTLLASGLYAKEAPAAVTMATAVELLHIATLIHDDTVDNSLTRRGMDTISSRWDENVAILLGDYVFAASATFVCDTNNIRVIRRFSETIMDLSSGQLLEYFNGHNVDQTRKLYEDRIYRKTASLFRTAAESGAILGGAPEEGIDALSQYGYNIGMAFQIVDDILDVSGDAEEIGKPVGNDLLQGVLTLPSIKLLERHPNDNPVRALFANPREKTYLQESLKMMQESDILEECQAEAEEYCAKALRILEGLPETRARESLSILASYVTKRQR